MKFVFVLLLFFILINDQSFSQVDSTLINDDLLDNILDEQDEETDNEDLIDVYEDLIRNPIELNTADVIELSQLPGIDPQTAQNIVDHRNKFGYFFSASELFSIKEIDKKTIENILPFVKVTLPKDDITTYEEPDYEYSQTLLKKVKLNFRSRFTNDIQDRDGFTSNKFEGSKLKSYNRLLLKFDKNYQAGVLIEKDPGEKSFNDFTSFHLFVKDISFIKSFIAGDYVLEFGQGLALWSAFGVSKSSDAILPIKKRFGGIRPYTSSAEFRFFRGASTTFRVDDFYLTAFYSNRNIDASVDSVTNEITAIGQTGFHRFESEIEKKNTVNEKLIGGVLEYRFLGKNNFGFIYYNTTFDRSFQSSSIYDLSGNKFNYLSAFYDVNVAAINLFGEASYNGTSVATVNGFQIAATNNLIFTSSIRSYPRNYNSLYGFGFSETSGKIKNELGFYSGIKLKSAFGVFNIYYDIFKFPYRTSSNSLSTQGDEFLIDYQQTLFAKFDFRFRYKYENKDITEEIDNNDLIVKRLRQSARSEFVFNLSKSIRLKSRFEYNSFQIKDGDIKENGILLFQDVRYAAAKNLTLAGRIIFFDTDSFSSAVYEFENDLLGVMPNLAMYGEGIRWYFIVKYKPIKFLSISAKYSETYKPDEKTLSSGDSEIIGNLDNRFSLQIDLSF